MKKIINIAFYRYDKKTINLIDFGNICEKAQKNNLFFMNINNNNLESVLCIFSEYEMKERTYKLLNEIYSNDKGFEMIIDNSLEDQNVKYNIIDL